MEQEEIKLEDVVSTEIKDPKKVLDALERAKTDAKKFREEKEQFKKQYEQAVVELNEWSAELLKERVAKKLEKDGLPNVDRLFKYLDFGKIGFDPEKDIVGLNEQMDTLKSDFPELFDAKIRVGGKANAAENNPVNTGLSTSELQAKYILGKI
jgi:hypothetical protein